MLDFYRELSGLEQAYFLCALLGGSLFVVRLVLMLVGGFGDADADGLGDVGHGDMPHGDFSSGDVGHGDLSHDASGHGSDSDSSFRVLSLQSLTAFFTMFGLVGLALKKGELYDDTPSSTLVSLVGATVAGVGTAWITERIFRFVGRFQSEGNVHAENAAGQEAVVYLGIPEAGVGKIQLTIQGRLREFDAVANDKGRIDTGTRVIVTQVVNDRLLVVSRLPGERAEGAISGA